MKDIAKSGHLNKLSGDMFFYVQRKPYFCITISYIIILNFRNMAYIISEDCIACGTCIDECPVGAISEGDIYAIDPDMCTDCGTCADVCPTEAIHPVA
jgi:ferredoxin